MKGCTLAEQHKGRVTDLFKASVWHLFSAGGTEDIMLDHAQPKGKEKEKKVKATQGKVVLLHLINKIQARPRCVSRRTIDSSLLIKRNDKLQKLADSVKF